ncbi:MAG: PDZ domain-containing protein [Clostridia bacterium]|nr:PDZ domain-containing protein [Clostridia bacterium]NCC44459.1 PDZ domain-containing protein [Clostridia bacterium]
MGTGKKFLVAAGMAVMFGVIAGGTMFGVNALGNQLSGQDRIPETQIPSTTVGGTEGEPGDNTGADVPAAGNEASESTPVNASGDFSVAEVANNCMPSVVSITNASVQSVQDFFGGVTQYPSESTGSGIIVGQNDTELLIATNNHVVAGAETLTVAFTDDAVCEAQTKGTAEDSDLAVISVKLDDMTEETLSAIKIVTLGDSDALSVGEQVVAIGNALGYGQSVTSGWVSAVNREVTDSEGNSSGKLIQTDAAINPGNSGGALLNMRGELIGINSAKAAATEVEGMGYAIPISLAQPILDELMNRETRYKASEDKAAYIGVTCMNVDSTAAAAYGIPVGAFVDSVEEGGPAEEVGIMKGDVIVKFDGVAVTGSTDLVSKIEYYEAGESVEVVYSRAENGEYKEHTATVTLGKKSEMKQTTEPNTTNQQ